MAFNFSISITTKWGETFKLEGAHSWDEALRMVEEGIYQRKLERQAKGLYTGDEQGFNLAKQAKPAVGGMTTPPPHPTTAGPEKPMETKPDMVQKIDDKNNVVETTHPNKKE